MVESAGASARKGPRLGCIIVAVGCVLLLILIGIPVINDALELANRSACMSNLIQVLTASRTWAQAHNSRWPDIDTPESTRWDKVGGTRTDRWDPVENEGEPPDVKPGDNGRPVNSNTANFWLLVASGRFPIHCFLCPSAASRFDTNFGAFDDVTAGKVRDFRGEPYCSYSYQNVLGDEYALMDTRDSIATRLVVIADASPLRRDFWSQAPSGGVNIGITNRKLESRPRFEESEETEPWNRQVKCIRRAWELNSPNHGFRGMNVGFLDGHVEWKTHPYCGPKWDNIWLRRRTDVSVEIDPNNIETLRACNDETSYNGTSTLPEDSQEDSFLVP
ncbi:MAG: hypothetical protein IMZ44_02590 [Planctomycetes bacterium]|nr:hypothetical protein [Planctomycetota bacterium]